MGRTVPSRLAGSDTVMVIGRTTGRASRRQRPGRSAEREPGVALIDEFDPVAERVVDVAAPHRKAAVVLFDRDGTRGRP